MSRSVGQRREWASIALMSRTMRESIVGVAIRHSRLRAASRCPSRCSASACANICAIVRRNVPCSCTVNFHDTHFPYHHEGIQSLVSETVVAQGDISPANELAVREMYLNTAANVDRAIKDLLLRVGETLGRDPGVVVLSDHGESLFEEGFLGHGYALNDAQTRIRADRCELARCNRGALRSVGPAKDAARRAG